MKAAQVPQLMILVNKWQEGDASLSDVAYILGWPLSRAEAILQNLGILGLDGRPTLDLDRKDICIMLLWYYVNILLARSSIRPVK